MNNKNFPEENEVLFGTVKRIIGPSVFVLLDEYNNEGVIFFSEVAPGRIRNIRDYVKIGQKIVCKVLKVNEATSHMDLSLRRVSSKEKKEVVDAHKREREVMIMLKISIKDKNKLEKISETIKEKIGFKSFIEELIEKPEDGHSRLVALGFSNDETSYFLNLVAEKAKERKVRVKIKISLTSEEKDGIEKIKKMLLEVGKEAKINYITAPYYSISVESKNYKEANKKIKEIISKIEMLSKKSGCSFAQIK